MNHCEWNIFINKNTSKKNFFLIDVSKSQGQKICIIDQACSIKMVDIGQVLFCDFMDRDAKIARADIQPPKKEHALSITDLLNSKIFRLQSRITSLKITMFRRKNSSLYRGKVIKKNLQKVRIRKKNALELLNEDGLIIAVRITNDGVGVLFKKLKITVLNLETGKQTRRRFKI